MNDTNNSMSGVAPVAGQPSAAAVAPSVDVSTAPASVGDAPAAVPPVNTPVMPPTASDPVVEAPVAGTGMGVVTEVPQAPVSSPTPAGMMNSNEGTDTDSGSSAPPVAGV